MVYNTNQVRQFYVATAYNASVTDASNAGTIGAVKVIDEGVDKEMYFLYKGADTVMKSDRIQLKNLNYVKAIAPEDMVVPLKSVEVALDSAVNSGKPKAGQDYVLRIAFRQFFGMGDEDQYFKDVAVHATAAMEATPSLFFTALVNALNLAFSREIGATATTNPYLTFTAAAAKLTITEKEQPWTLGTEAQERVYFDVYPTTVFVDGEDVIWGTVTDVTPAKYVEDTDSNSSTYQEMIPNPAVVVGTNAIGNGKRIADMEYFFMGERGDQYRMIGWPNHIPTTYLVNPTSEYYVLEMHYGFTDTGVNSYRTEKDITIVCASKSDINSLIGAINTAAGTSIDTFA